MFLPLEEARRQPLLREYMAEQYGEKLSTPETVDVEALEAREEDKKDGSCPDGREPVSMRGFNFPKGLR